ncbi:MAG: hypothetical protein FWD68_00840 [Alphaproteobacteria bacterium]|nr:hypothetical protein [Alphaproteobacteria bacterium]
MRTISSSVLVVLISSLLLPQTAFGEKAVDVETLRQADAIMARMKVARDESELSSLVAEFLPLVTTPGLSEPCQRLLISMQSSAAKQPPEELNDLPSSMKATMKTQFDTSEAEMLAGQRKACVEARSAVAERATTITRGLQRVAEQKPPPAPTPAPAIRQIDPEVIAQNFRNGSFAAVTNDVGADGKAEQKTEDMCMNAASANLLVFGVLAGVAGCEVQSSEEDKVSISVTATCPATSDLAPNFYRATLHWATDGKEIEMDTKRLAIEEGKPADKVLKEVSMKLRHQSDSCK